MVTYLLCITLFQITDKSLQQFGVYSSKNLLCMIICSLGKINSWNFHAKIFHVKMHIFIFLTYFSLLYLYNDNIS